MATLTNGSDIHAYFSGVSSDYYIYHGDADQRKWRQYIFQWCPFRLLLNVAVRTQDLFVFRLLTPLFCPAANPGPGPSADQTHDPGNEGAGNLAW